MDVLRVRIIHVRADSIGLTREHWGWKISHPIVTPEEVGHSPGSQTVGRFARNPGARAPGPDDERVG